MSRTWFVWILVSLVAVTAGCAMCASPYDYCAPTFTGECGKDCRPNARVGSILTGATEMGPHEMYEEMDSGVILSVTDASLDNPPEVQQGVPHLADRQPVQSQGWTAQKPAGVVPL